MIPARFAAVIFGFILSGLMSCIVAGIATFRVLQAGEAFITPWMTS